jgi:hypothetical protein
LACDSSSKGLSGEYQMKLRDGGYLQFHDVDFDGGTTLELRLDNPAGTLIGAAKG